MNNQEVERLFERLIQMKDASRILNLTGPGVILLCERGTLPFYRLPDRTRVFDRNVVEKVAQAREAERNTKQLEKKVPRSKRVA